MSSQYGVVPSLHGLVPTALTMDATQDGPPVLSRLPEWSEFYPSGVTQETPRSLHLVRMSDKTADGLGSMLLVNSLPVHCPSTALQMCLIAFGAIQMPPTCLPVVAPRYARHVEKVAERSVLETRVNPRVFDALRIDQRHCRSWRVQYIRRAECAVFSASENAVVVVIRRRSRCRSKQELMRREAGPLVGLEKMVSPTIGMDDIQIRLQLTRINEPVGRFRFRAWPSFWVATHPRGPVHRASAVSVLVAHGNEAAVYVVKIVAEAERGLVWIGIALGRGFIEPPRGLDVVLFWPRLGAARGRVCCCWCAQSLEKIVRRAVFLDDDDDVLEGGDLGRGRRRQTDRR